jgi:toxin ParE1/3/4
MRVAFTLAARRDLLQISDFIAEDNLQRAIRVVDELEQHCFKIGSRPHAYPVIAHADDRDIRRTVHGRYLIFYDIVSRTVRILRIIHGARDWERLLFPPE